LHQVGTSSLLRSKLICPTLMVWTYNMVLISYIMYLIFEVLKAVIRKLLLTSDAWLCGTANGPRDILTKLYGFATDNMGIYFCFSRLFPQWPIPFTVGSASTRLLGLRVQIPPGAWTSFPYECCVLSGWGLCFGLITRPEKSYQVWSVWIWSWGLWPTRSCCALV